MLNDNLKLEESLPEYIDWFLKSKGLTVVEEKNSSPKIVPIKESKEVYRNRELEQTQELLVSLTQELFNKIEELESEKEIKKMETELKEEFKDNQAKTREETKITFSDLSWYREKLNNSKK